MAIVVNDDVSDGMADGLALLWNTLLGSSGTLEFFDGTEPAACSDPDDGNMIISFGLNATPFTTATGINFSANAIGAGACVFAGTTTYWRMKDGSSNVVLQGSSGLSGADINWDDNTWFVSDVGNISNIDITVQTGG